MSEPTIETEIAVLKEQLKYVIEGVDRIKDNHLPHIYDRLGTIEKRMAYYFGSFATVMVVVDIIIKMIK